MKLKFKKQQFQSDAVAAVVDLFKGQASSVSPFTVGKLDIIDYAQDSVFGYGNTLTLTAEEITRNLHEVQQRNLLPLTEPEQLRFNIEMETGTGKTFVYTKTIYELNKRYGFNKFVILVPSVAIREGAYKSLQITEEYFRQEYDGKRAHFFIYDSKKRNEVRDFALSTNLEIMIVNIDAIKRMKIFSIRKAIKWTRRPVNLWRSVVLFLSSTSRRASTIRTNREKQSKTSIPCANSVIQQRTSRCSIPCTA